MKNMDLTSFCSPAAVAIATLLLCSCASLLIPSGPPGECLRNADYARSDAVAEAKRAGASVDTAARYGESVRNSARVACAVLGTMVIQSAESLKTGASKSASEASYFAGVRLQGVMIGAFRQGMLRSPSSSGRGSSPEELGEKAAGLARPFMPATRAEFIDHVAGWQAVVRRVESDTAIPGAKAVIALAGSIPSR